MCSIVPIGDDIDWPDRAAIRFRPRGTVGPERQAAGAHSSWLLVGRVLLPWLLLAVPGFLGESLGWPAVACCIFQACEHCSMSRAPKLQLAVRKAPHNPQVLSLASMQSRGWTPK